jgi:hypothetical protein
VVDLFACSLDQVGVAEMKVCVEKTGGLLVLDDSFTHNVFTGSFKRVFAVDQKNELVMSFNGELQVLTSREFKVAGAIGCCTSLERKSPSVAESGEFPRAPLRCSSPVFSRLFGGVQRRVWATRARGRWAAWTRPRQ